MRTSEREWISRDLFIFVVPYVLQPLVQIAASPCHKRDAFSLPAGFHQATFVLVRNESIPQGVPKRSSRRCWRTFVDASTTGRYIDRNLVMAQISNPSTGMPRPRINLLSISPLCLCYHFEHHCPRTALRLELITRRSEFRVHRAFIEIG